MPVSQTGRFQPGSSGLGLRLRRDKSIPATALRQHLVLDKSQPFFNSCRGIINNKSELGIRVEKLLPELSSPFLDEQCQGGQTG
jgi:hypothetical protein